MIKFHGLNKLSLVDYPEHMSAILFTGYCNFRCPFCHNSSLVLDPESQGVLDNDEILSFLRKRKKTARGQQPAALYYDRAVVKRSFGREYAL